MKLRIEIGEGWYPQVGLVIDVGGEDYFIESVSPDPDALHRIGIPNRVASSRSVIANLRLATDHERAESVEQERVDTDDWLKAMAKRR